MMIYTCQNTYTYFCNSFDGVQRDTENHYSQPTGAAIVHYLPDSLILSARLFLAFHSLYLPYLF